jgi:hypothetical protein
MGGMGINIVLAQYLKLLDHYIFFSLNRWETDPDFTIQICIL